jgi:hypothetical protein
VLVMEVAQAGAVFAQAGAVFKLGLQVGVVKLEWSSWCIQVGVFEVGVCRSGVVNSWFPSF